MSSENWIDISHFLSVKKSEMTDFDHGEKKIMIMNVNGVFYASNQYVHMHMLI